MRRAIAISLMMLFSWTLIAPFFAPDVQASLPACCRKNGKHHCAMRIMGLLAGNQRGFTTVAEKCPRCPLNAARQIHLNIKQNLPAHFIPSLFLIPCLRSKLRLIFESRLSAAIKSAAPLSHDNLW
jgi:hypothetical protein